MEDRKKLSIRVTDATGVHTVHIAYIEPSLHRKLRRYIDNGGFSLSFYISKWLYDDFCLCADLESVDGIQDMKDAVIEALCTDIKEDLQLEMVGVGRQGLFPAWIKYHIRHL